MLLSHIRRAQGRKGEALLLANKQLNCRQKAHGHRFEACDSIYDAACLLHEQRQTDMALGFLK